MRAVMAFAGKAGRMATATGKVGTASGKFDGKTLGGMSRGLSAVSTLMEYAGERQRAAAFEQEARDEEMASRQEYITAAERVNAIDAEYVALVGRQLEAAPAMGIDVGSGSVVAAREAAQSEADRERRIIRNSADAQAKQRRIRAMSLRQSAKNTRFGAGVSAAIGLASAAFG